MAISLRTKLIASFVVVILAMGAVVTWVGVHLIADRIIRQAQGKVRIDLNSAREIYREKSEKVRDVVRLTATRFFLKEGPSGNNFELMKSELQKIRIKESLDVLTLTDRNGIVIFRARNPEVYGDSQANNEIVERVLSTNEVVASTEIVTSDELAKEGKDLAEQCRIGFIPTPKAKPRPEHEETAGMMIKSAAPVLDEENNLLAVLYGGVLLNRNYDIVDKIKETVYQGEIYEGKEIGTATIFQGDLRISTNVRREDGSRAIGTRVSEEVYDQVLVQGLPWMERAFVVNDWYITAYEPIMNLSGKIIGMLYVGMLEAPYVDLRNRVLCTFIGVSFLTIVFMSLVIDFLTGKTLKPVNKLLLAMKRVAAGDLSHRVEIGSRDEIGQLAVSFNEMTAELEKTTNEYQSLTRTLEDKVKEKTRELEDAQDQLIQTEKLSALGKLAAGIAHEINNPLTSILINAHLMSEKLGGRHRFAENLELIIDETIRCSGIVGGLLEFSRQAPAQKQITDINQVIQKTLLLFESKMLASKVKIKMDLDTSIPGIWVDANKIKQVFTNIIVNGLDAMPDGGTLTIRSRTSKNKCVEIEFQDTGSGIPKDKMNKIFDPFFTTKGIKGTGLGLSVSLGIIQQHDGTIDVVSQEGKGTSVTVGLPIVKDGKCSDGRQRF